MTESHNKFHGFHDLCFFRTVKNFVAMWLPKKQQSVTENVGRFSESDVEQRRRASLFLSEITLGSLFLPVQME